MSAGAYGGQRCWILLEMESWRLWARCGCEHRVLGSWEWWVVFTANQPSPALLLHSWPRLPCSFLPMASFVTWVLIGIQPSLGMTVYFSMLWPSVIISKPYLSSFPQGTVLSPDLVLLMTSFVHCTLLMLSHILLPLLLYLWWYCQYVCVLTMAF